LHGEDDPYVLPDEVADFEKEMRNAEKNYTIIKYEGAVHGFTNPEAEDRKVRGVAYNATADRNSWEEMKRFLAEPY
jgi:dienelactone hydrolase